jgi:hypothetical protein
MQRFAYQAGKAQLHGLIPKNDELRPSFAVFGTSPNVRFQDSVVAQPFDSRYLYTCSKED